MTGDWKVQLEDSAHSIHAEASYMTGQLLVTWDERVQESRTVWWLAGDIHTFRKNGHVFVLSIKGPWYLGHFVLTLDGTVVERSDSARNIAPAAQRTAVADLQFLADQNVKETEEIVAVEDFPLDNTFGSDSFSTERLVSRESTNELTLQDSNQLSGNLSLSLFQALKAEVAAQVSRQTGSRIGEKVTETQTLRFTVGANKSVLYKVIWKRKVRTGEHVYFAGGTRLMVPYRLNYGLSCQMRTVDPKNPRDEAAKE